MRRTRQYFIDMGKPSFGLPEIVAGTTLSYSAVRNDVMSGRLVARKFASTNGRGRWVVDLDDLLAWLDGAFLQHEPRTRQRPTLADELVLVP